MMKVRLLDLGIVSVLRSQTIYHGLTSAIKPDDNPIITLIQPDGTYVSTGYSQEAAKEVDLEYCSQNNIMVIRRHVGGGAVLLDENQLFFHVILPVARTSEFGLPRKLVNKFAYLAKAPIHAYHKMGINASFRPINDIQVEGKKIGGTGTGEINEGLVFAGSIMMDFNHALMAKVLKVPDEKMRDKIHQTLESYITTIKRESDYVKPVSEIKDILSQSFSDVYNIELESDTIKEYEWKEIENYDRLLLSDNWLNAVNLKDKDHRDVKISAHVRIISAAHKAPGGMMRATVRVIDNKIDDLLISGDFAFAPQNGLDKLVEKFSGSHLDYDELRSRILKLFQEKSLDFAGVELNDFEQLFQQITA